MFGPAFPGVLDFLHPSVVVCWICLEDDATPTDALEDGGWGCGVIIYVRLDMLGR